MNIVEKREYIYSHLHQVSEAEINELYEKMVSLINDSLMEESEEDIKNDNLTTHEAFKREIQTWKHTK